MEHVPSWLIRTYVDETFVPSLESLHGITIDHLAVISSVYSIALEDPEYIVGFWSGDSFDTRLAIEEDMLHSHHVVTPYEFVALINVLVNCRVKKLTLVNLNLHQIARFQKPYSYIFDRLKFHQNHFYNILGEWDTIPDPSLLILEDLEIHHCRGTDLFMRKLLFTDKCYLKYALTLRHITIRHSFRRYSTIQLLSKMMDNIFHVVKFDIGLESLKQNFDYGGARVMANIERCLERNRKGYNACRESIFCLLLIRRYRKSDLSLVNKDVMMIICRNLFETRGDIKWIFGSNALSACSRINHHGHICTYSKPK